jgi:arylsulfatase A-like enzyme
MPDVPVGEWTHIFNEHADPLNPNALVGEVSLNRSQRARAGYYGHMSHIDSQLQRFCEILREYSLYDNTWFIFTADHGEMMGDHHLWRKAYPYEGSAHVPMIIKPPTNSSLPKRVKLDTPVCLRDVMPTVLDAAGLPIPESLDGYSMLAIAKGERAEDRPLLQGEHMQFGNNSIMYVTNGHQKFVWFSESGHEQFFDLDVDPQELHDCQNDHEYADQIAIFRQHLIKELAGREEGFTDGKTLIPGQTVHPTLSFLQG